MRIAPKPRFTLLGRSWQLLGGSWAAPAASWGALGPLLRPPGALLGLILTSLGPPLGASWAPLGPPGGPPSRPGRPKKPQKHEKSTKTRKVSYFTRFQLGTPRFRSVWLHFGPPKRSQIERKRWSPSQNLVFYEGSRVHVHAFFRAPGSSNTRVLRVFSSF